MAAALQVANAFAVDFVERVAKNAANLAEVYGRHATLTINDFELGISELHDGDVPIAAQKWAASLQGSRLRVDSVNAAPLYGGVNVFLTLTAFGELQQYFHVATTLESYQDTFGMDGFYVRHQVIARIGAVAPEAPAAPAVPEPTPAVEEKAATPAKTPQPEPVAEQPRKTPTPEPTPEPAAEEKAVEAEHAVAAPAPAEVEAEKAPAAAAPAASTKPKSWASLVSHAPVKTAEHRPVRVVAREGGEKENASAKKESASTKKESASTKKEATVAPKDAAEKRHSPRERKAPQAVGDRLMFNVTGAVTDDEVRAALGPVAEHLVSLRNNSARGLVFMDFAENFAALEEITKAQPVIGASKAKMSVFRQRARE